MAKEKLQPGLTELPPENSELAALRAQVDTLTQLVQQGVADKVRLEGKLQELATIRAGAVIDESFEAWKEWAAKSATEKTQIEIEKKWGHETTPRWQVSLPGHPSVLIPARDEDEAQLRYNRICGILAILNNNPDRPLKHAISRVAAA